jgi:hypothetical protein
VALALVTPGTANRLCSPLLTRAAVSGQGGNDVVLNARRWLRGAPAYGKDVTRSRAYPVNHELEQAEELGGCRKYPWPTTTGH